MACLKKPHPNQFPLMAALRAGRNDTVSVVQRNRAADGVDAAPQYRSSRSTMP